MADKPANTALLQVKLFRPWNAMTSAVLMWKPFKNPKIGSSLQRTHCEALAIGREAQTQVIIIETRVGDDVGPVVGHSANGAAAYVFRDERPVPSFVVKAVERCTVRGPREHAAVQTAKRAPPLTVGRNNHRPGRGFTCDPFAGR